MASDALDPPSSASTAFVYAPYTASQSGIVPAYWAQRYEDDAAVYWDQFYARHANHFFKDRHYLGKEWSELKVEEDAGEEQADDGAAAERDEVRSLCAAASELVLLEAGCGAGNTLLPLLRANPSLRVFAFDFSERAVELVKADPLHQTGRIVAAVGDLTTGELPEAIAGCDAHLCTLMFVLSAISEPKMPAALRAIRAGLREGGLVLFRDYAVGDGAQRRLQSARDAKQLDESARFFVRQDGTRAYYFSVEQLSELWEAAGFDVVRCEYSARQTVNHKKGVTLDRLYVTAKFRKRPDGQATPAPRPAHAAPPATAAGRLAAPAVPRAAVQLAPGRGAHEGEANAVGMAADAAPGAPGDERACAWRAAKESVHACVREALGEHASTEQQCQLLEEVRSELLVS